MRITGYARGMRPRTDARRSDGARNDARNDTRNDARNDTRNDARNDARNDTRRRDADGGMPCEL